MRSIELESVSKYFRDFCAVDDVSFGVDREEIVGFVGPNGAGKSTCLKMLATYLTPTRGKVAVEGLDSVESSLGVRRRIGYLSGDTPLYAQMRVDRLVRFVAEARGLEGGDLRTGIERVVEVCGIEPVMTKRVSACSTGFRQRVGLATALVHDPAVLILDEPTHGFDPIQVLAFRETLEGLKAGRAILFSSHIIQEVSALSDRIVIINEGRILADGPPGELAKEAGRETTEMDEVFAHFVRSQPSESRV
ncbi:MAG: multidrug ABC transporter ATP-binding protein [Gemmatimonadetes bacterium]|nr:multidrug ABC transporter ATP-binding protein [Gemmatimonadota bacterium]|tara:strand:- start:4623 stop:5369 length:747 start_codon:yes stop_codon:yes gene_type:complete